MGKPIILFTGTSGLNNVIDPTRLRFDPKTGISDLAIAHNVDIDDTGRPSRRGGFDLSDQTGEWHSLFCDGGSALGVSGDALALISQDLGGYTPLRNVTRGAKMRYCQVKDFIYYSNQREIGVVVNEVSQSWVGADYVGPTTQRTFSDPPICKLLANYNGRMFLSVDTRVLYSEPYAYAWYDMARNWLPFRSEILMIAPVKDGIYFSDSHNIYFCQGNNPQDFDKRVMATYPAIEDTNVTKEGASLKGGEFGFEHYAMFSTTKGICAGFPSGLFINLTEKKLIFPSAKSGSAAIVQGKYMTLLNP